MVPGRQPAEYDDIRFVSAPERHVWETTARRTPYRWPWYQRQAAAGSRRRSVVAPLHVISGERRSHGRSVRPVIGRCPRTVLESSARSYIRLVGLPVPILRGRRCAQSGSRNPEDRPNVVRSMNLPAGYVIGSYQIDREISRGSHAVIYRAWQRSVGRWVALKVLSKHGSRPLASFRREIQLTGNVRHPGVRQVYDAGETPDGYPYLAMQFVDTSLREMLRRCQGQARKFSRGEVLRYLKPIADVLDHIHKQGIVHLDVKPENILMFGDGRVVLADFGSAVRVGSMTHQGTPRYLSPEQAAGNRPVGPWSDVYSLACVGYEMLAGQPPFGGDLDVVLVRQHLTEAPTPLRELRPDLSRRVQRPFDDALSKDPRGRPASADAFIELLRRGGRETALASGSKGLVIAGGVALIALAVIVILITVYWLRLAASPAQFPDAGGLSSSMPSPLPTSLPALACASVMPAILCPASTRLSGADRVRLMVPNADGYPAPEPSCRSYHWLAAAVLA